MCAAGGQSQASILGGLFECSKLELSDWLVNVVIRRDTRQMKYRRELHDKAICTIKKRHGVMFATYIIQAHT